MVSITESQGVLSVIRLCQVFVNNVIVTIGNQELFSFLDIKHVYTGMHASIQGEETII